VKPYTPTIAQPSVYWQGKTVTLTCTTTTTTSGGHVFTFTWFKDGVTLSGETASVLSKAAEISDVGNYTCSVTYLSVASDVSNSVTLNVRGRSTILLLVEILPSGKETTAKPWLLQNAHFLSPDGETSTSLRLVIPLSHLASNRTWFSGPDKQEIFISIVPAVIYFKMVLFVCVVVSDADTHYNHPI
jgi:hypothetical protein